jgi:hypothetical protein
MTYSRAYRFWELMYSSHVHDGGSELDEPRSIVSGIHFVQSQALVIDLEVQRQTATIFQVEH